MTTKCSTLKLPDELLAAIAKNLVKRGWLALLLTSKRLRGAAQELLYHSVEIRTDISHHNKHLLFMRTLLERPDLAAKVRVLSLWLGAMLSLEAGATRFTTPHAEERRATVFKEDLMDTRTRIVELWSERYRGKHIAWHTGLREGVHSSFAGFLLTLVPSITELTFGIHDRDGLGTSDPIVDLFGSALPDAPRVPCFQTIGKLDIRLEHLKFLGNAMPHVHTLIMEDFQFEDLDELRGAEWTAPPWSLRKLRLTGWKRRHWEFYSHDWTAALQWLASKLNANYVPTLAVAFVDCDSETVDYKFTLGLVRSIWPHVRDLTIPCDLDFTSEWNPDIAALNELHALVKLSVGTDALISEERPRELKAIPRKLPPNLETLHVTMHHGRFMQWLEAFLVHHKLFKSLRRIQVDIVEDSFIWEVHGNRLKHLREEAYVDLRRKATSGGVDLDIVMIHEWLEGLHG